MSVTDTIEAIYNSEINCRLEWLWDAGFTWSIQNSDYPRLMIDDDLSGDFKIITETSKSMLSRTDPFIKKDWVERGSNYSFEDSVKELAEAICRLFPNSSFALNYD